jgi:hypothetical protein
VRALLPQDHRREAGQDRDRVGLAVVARHVGEGGPERHGSGRDQACRRPGAAPAEVVLHEPRDRDVGDDRRQLDHVLVGQPEPAVHPLGDLDPDQEPARVRPARDRLALVDDAVERQPVLVICVRDQPERIDVEREPVGGEVPDEPADQAHEQQPPEQLLLAARHAFVSSA